MKTDFEEKVIHGSFLFPFQYFHSHRNSTVKILVPCHWHENTEILFIENGPLQIIIDGISFTGNTGDIFFFNPERFHQINGTKLDNSYYSFVFSLSMLDFQTEDYTQAALIRPLCRERWFPSRVSSETPGYPELLQIMHTLRDLSVNRPVAFQLLIKAELYRLIAILEQHGLFLLESSQISRSHSQTALRLKEVLQYVAEHYQENITLEQAASVMHMTPKYFSNYFSSTFHISFVQYLNRYRIEKACLLLQTTDMPVMEAGFEAGYENFSYFIRRFKEFQGCTPSDYRKRLNHPEAWKAGL